MELPFSTLNTSQREQVHTRFRDDLFRVDPANYLYQFTPGGLYRRPIKPSPPRKTRAKRNPTIVVIETGAPVLSEAVMDILIRAYLNHTGVQPHDNRSRNQNPNCPHPQSPRPAQ